MVVLSRLRGVGINKRYYTQAIKLNEIVFDKSKIINVTARPSYFWFKYPFVLEITYNEPCKVISNILMGNVVVPYECTMSDTYYSFKYNNKKDLEHNLMNFSDCPNAQICNKIDL